MEAQGEAAEAVEQRGSYDPGVREPAGCWTRIVSCDRDAYRRWVRVLLDFQN